jgi:leucyl/phenylalanyl-tRNA--protein transferase
MARVDNILIDITPEVLLKAYACGIFPMAESADDNGLYWIEPERRGVLPLDGFHVPSRLARTVRADKFEIRIDEDFEAVIEHCAAERGDRPRTWINPRIRRLYRDLFDLGQCHTVEARVDGALVGGLYGVRIGAAFFAESKFSRPAIGGTDASKIALVRTVEHLHALGFALMDVQFWNEHLDRFGCLEIPRAEYLRRLSAAVARTVAWRPLALPATA